MANYDLGTIGFTVQNTGAEESTADVNLLVQAIERAEKQFDTLQRALNKGKLSQEQYQRGVQQTTQTVERLNRIMQNQGSALDQQTFAFNRAGRGMNEFGFYAQQVGYQVGDFFVQVQSGTNFLVAFGQQATQLAGLIPGVLGAAIGIGISALTAIGSAFFRSTEGAKTFQDSLSSVNDVLSETSSLVKVANGDFSELEERFGSLAPAIKALAETRAEVSIRQMTDAAKELNTQLTDMYSGSAWTNVSRAEDLANAFSLNTRESRNLANAMSELASQDTLGGQVEAATALRETLLETFGPVREMTSEQFNFYLQVLQTEEAYRELLNRTGEVSGEISLMEGAMALFTDASSAAVVAVNGIETAASSALGVVTNLVTKMWEAVQARIAANRELETMKMEFSPAGQALKRYGSRGTVSNRPVTFSDGTELEKPRPSRGGTARRETELRKQIDLTKELTQAEKDRQTIVRSIESSLEDGFMSMVDGTKSVKDAFKSMARDIIKELYRVLVVQRMVNSIAGAINGFFSPATPTTTSFNTPNFFVGGRASGGSIMGGTPYLVGEHGPELVIPRHSGTVVNANQTANALGGGAGNVTVQNNITVTGSDAAMVRAEVAKMIPQITNATKAAVIDAKQRGGQMAAAFR